MNQELRWDTSTRGERVFLVIAWGVMWGVVFPLLCLAGLVAIGTIIDGFTERANNLERCQKHAATPYEYHRCK